MFWAFIVQQSCVSKLIKVIITQVKHNELTHFVGYRDQFDSLKVHYGLLFDLTVTENDNASPPKKLTKLSFDSTTNPDVGLPLVGKETVLLIFCRLTKDGYCRKVRIFLW